ncbi:nucleotidyltransferase domain-containing protein [Priestia filamentosa]|uniref:nucleotidyltransferase domain-containing protein n=1 Tax=Priestia filamentosa TaxID=1402861 RepID=UPI003981C806
MKNIVLDTLKKIERDYNVKVLYACESGSRVWGFPSKDSDYDVRFIYVHHPEDYLVIDPMGVGTRRDVIELPINDELDVSGWELTKALKLFRKGNAPLLEWLNSDIVYYEKFSTIQQMRDLIKDIFAPTSAIYHYLNMARNNFREFIQGEEVKIKKYFYVLRPVLACRWIEQYNEFPPLHFELLLDKVIPQGELKREIFVLLERKKAGDELDLEPRINAINEFLEAQIAHLNAYAKSLKFNPDNPTDRLNKIFKSTLDEVWA